MESIVRNTILIGILLIIQTANTVSWSSPPKVKIVEVEEIDVEMEEYPKSPRNSLDQMSEEKTDKETTIDEYVDVALTDEPAKKDDNASSQNNHDKTPSQTERVKKTQDDGCCHIL